MWNLIVSVPDHGFFICCPDELPFFLIKPSVFYHEKITDPESKTIIFALDILRMLHCIYDILSPTRNDVDGVKERGNTGGFIAYLFTSYQNYNVVKSRVNLCV